MKSMVWVLGAAAGVLAGLFGVAAPAGVAQADPALPDVPPYLPDAPLPYPGSYLYPYNLIPVYGPATTDARGIRATGTVDPAMSATGMPGSQLGLAPNKSNELGTYSSMRNNISAGPAPEQTVQPGVSIGAGVVMPTVEDPTGAPPKSPIDAESAQPGTAPAVPGNSQVMEDPTGQPAAAAPAAAEAQAPATAPQAVQVWPQTPGFAPGAPGTGPGPGISAGPSALG